jgi:hypothetical protein
MDHLPQCHYVLHSVGATFPCKHCRGNREVDSYQDCNDDNDDDDCPMLQGACGLGWTPILFRSLLFDC